nr:hypothetical protein CFP56_20599 [Quercus suber]
MMEHLEDNDDYVAELLRASADKKHSRYLTHGLSGLLSKESRDNNAAKPNTRFLRQLIRETDSHNAALKQKEEADSRARLRSLGAKKERDGRWANAFSGLSGSKHEKKRKRGDDDVARRSEKRRLEKDDTNRGERAGRWSSALNGLGNGQQERKRDDRCRDNAEDDHRQHRSRPPRHVRDGHVESRHTENERAGSRSQDLRSWHERCANGMPSRLPKAEEVMKPQRRNTEEDLAENSSDSDPLSSIIGPSPPSKSTRPRGRNAHQATTSAMDARFEPCYDPKLDIHATALTEDDGDDWDLALEALRDRAKWQRTGAERLKAAGFTEEEVKRWEKGGEKGVEDVKWSKKGEGREWDRGKVIDDDGAIVMKPLWARTQGSAD